MKINKIYKKLFLELNNYKINYCHWKSNINLSDALAGSDDLDLLVLDSDYSSLIEVVKTFDFIPFESKIKYLNTKSVEHYYYYDLENNIFLHLHIFSKVITGNSFVKNYCFNIDDMIFKNVDSSSFIPIPNKESETLIFILRNIVKHSNIVDLILLNRNYEFVISEYNFLKNKSKEGFINDFFISNYKCNDVVNQFEKMLFSKKTIYKYFYAKYLSSFLKTSKNISPLIYFYKICITLVQGFLYKFLFKEKFKILKNGGIIIAFSGAKATGKSTLSNMLFLNFSKVFSVKKYHLGKPKSSFCMFLPNLLIKIFKNIFPSKKTTTIEMNLSKLKTKSFSLIYILRKYILAFDRLNTYKKIIKDKKNGNLIITDRFPSKIINASDSPSFSMDEIKSESNCIKKFFMKKELFYYSKINDPDIVFHLSIDLDSAIARDKNRKKDANPNKENIIFRHTKKNTPLYKNSKVLNINTKKNIKDTLLEVNTFFWKNIN